MHFVWSSRAIGGFHTKRRTYSMLLTICDMIMSAEERYPWIFVRLNGCADKEERQLLGYLKRFSPLYLLPTSPRLIQELITLFLAKSI